jgi:hypothetical protein
MEINQNAGAQPGAQIGPPKVSRLKMLSADQTPVYHQRLIRALPELAGMNAWH